MTPHYGSITFSSIFNTIQLVFVAIAYICTKRVANLYKGLFTRLYAKSKMCTKRFHTKANEELPATLSTSRTTCTSLAHSRIQESLSISLPHSNYKGHVPDRLYYIHIYILYTYHYRVHNIIIMTLYITLHTYITDLCLSKCLLLQYLHCAILYYNCVFFIAEHI